MVEYGRFGRSCRKESVRSSSGRTIMGKAIRESSIKNTFGEKFKLGMFIRWSRGRTILVCVCGRKKAGWKETEHQSDVENTNERRWFGRTNILSWPCLFIWVALRENARLTRMLWIITKVCSNQGFLLVPWKITRNDSSKEIWRRYYLFIVPWHGRSREEMCGTILRTGE